MKKYYIYNGETLKETKLTKEVKRIFDLKRCKNKPIAIFHGWSPNPLEHYRAFEITPQGLKQLTGSGWHFVIYEVFLNEDAIKTKWRDYIE